jgi:transcription termination/antitermination protein NusG
MSDIDTDTNEPEVDVSGPPADETPDEAGGDDVIHDDTAADGDTVTADGAADEADTAEAAAAADADGADAAEPAVDASADAAEPAVDAPADAAGPAVEAGAGEVAEPGPEAAASGQAPADAAAETVEAADADVEAAEPEVAGTDVIAAEELLERPPAESPYDRPGRWFVVHTQSGYEKKVKQNLEARIVSMNAEDAIYEVVIPMEDYVDFRNGKRVVAQRKMFPGYLLVRSRLDDQAWFVIRNTPGVTGFVGQGAKPSPLPRRDVESFLMPKGGTEEQVAQRAKPRLEYEIGETVRVKEGPFADFSGEVIELNEDQLKLKVLVNIFGRETPVELEFSKVAKL